MLVPFNTLPKDARVWIYQSNREFSASELELISNNTERFIETWTRHGENLKASYTIKYNQFIVLGVDESFNDVSGCSIDSSVHFIKQLETKLNIDLTNKLNTAFKVGQNINIVSLAQFQDFAKADKINADTIVFNNMVATKGDFDSNWEVKASESWHQRFLNSTKI